MSDANKQLNEILEQKLQAKKSAGGYRSLVKVEDKTDFCSNDYLGFSRLPQLKKLKDGVLPAGSTGSRLVSGNSVLAEDTEQLIASYHQAEAALIFNSGYDANIGLFSCIAARGDSIITDELIHASIIDGCRLGHANRSKFQHNDLDDLEKKLQQAVGQKFVVVESIYSMDGDEAPLEQIATLCKQYNAHLLVDEAHATGVFGINGRGLVCKYGLQEDVFACIYTFGKALGLHGAAITGSYTLRNYLVNFARSFIYTTALPPHLYLQLREAYQLLPDANRSTLFDLVEYFRQKAAHINHLDFIESYSPIQGIIIGNNTVTKALENLLMGKGFFAKAILSPTVPEGKERIRICLHSFNTKDEVDGLLIEVKNFSK